MPPPPACAVQAGPVQGGAGLTLDLFQVSDEVAEALASNRPVVALETTVVTHGLPHPRGLEVALRLEQVARDCGAVPATMAILGGRARVGVTPEELEELTRAEPVKVNLGNLGAVLAAGKAGSTTVAATMALADRAGIRVFATGGLGGVHRGASETGDVSADLSALARFPVAVVCAGAKALLDLPRTIEALETGGIPVLGYRTDEFPAFYRRASGLRVDERADSPARLAAIAKAHWAFSRTGLVIGNPIPEAFEMPEKQYRAAIEQAHRDLEQSGVRGREVTPFLLERLDRITRGQSVLSNRALLESNARLAAEVAGELA